MNNIKVSCNNWLKYADIAMLIYTNALKTKKCHLDNQWLKISLKIFTII